ncbi:MAG TPA: MlaD family protein [Gemmatimonadaceae bacterium]|jgi:phospholipid/cholesterol/gamma-HCH transport system substrate-binding protein
MKRRDEVTVGVLITVAVVVLVLGTLWLARGGLKTGYPLYTRFEWGQNLKTGQPVLLAGVSVGYVGDVTLRREGHLDVLLTIHDQYTIPKGSKATVKAVGIFGDVAVALTPPLPVPAASYAPGDTVPPGPPAADFDEILSRVDSIGTSVSKLTRAIQVELVEAGTLKDIHNTVASAAQLSAALHVAITEQNRNITQTLALQNQNLTQTLGAFRDAAGHISRLADSTQVDSIIRNTRQASANAAKLVANIDSTNGQIRALLGQIQHGNGTLGKLASDTLLYSDLRHTVASMDSLLVDFKKNPRKYINLKIF